MNKPKLSAAITASSTCSGSAQVTVRHCVITGLQNGRGRDGPLEASRSTQTSAGAVGYAAKAHHVPLISTTFCK